MMTISRDEGRKAVKILVETSNQICLNSLHELAKRELSKFISTSSRLNSNGGYLMHFLDETGALACLEMIKNTVQEKDGEAKIIVCNCPNFQPP